MTKAIIISFVIFFGGLSTGVLLTNNQNLPIDDDNCSISCASIESLNIINREKLSNLLKIKNKNEKFHSIQNYYSNIIVAFLSALGLKQYEKELLQLQRELINLNKCETAKENLYAKTDNDKDVIKKDNNDISDEQATRSNSFKQQQFDDSIPLPKKRKNTINLDEIKITKVFNNSMPVIPRNKLLERLNGDFTILVRTIKKQKWKISLNNYCRRLKMSYQCNTKIFVNYGNGKTSQWNTQKRKQGFFMQEPGNKNNILMLLGAKYFLYLNDSSKSIKGILFKRGMGEKVFSKWGEITFINKK